MRNPSYIFIKEKNDELDAEIKKLQELVDNTDKPLDGSTVDAAKEALKNAGASKVVVGSTYRGLEPYIVAAGFYFIMTFTLGRVISLIERRMKKSDSR